MWILQRFIRVRGHIIFPLALVHLSVGFPQPAPLKCFVFGAKLSIFSKTERCLTLKIGYTWVMYGSVRGFGGGTCTR